MHESRSDLAEAARETGMIWAGLFALGVSFGILVTSHGLPWWLAPVISGTMFAGSVESLLIGMFAASAPVAAIAVTTFLVNSRHLFYGLSFPLHRVRGRLRKAYSVFALCDEAYALMTSKDPRSVTSARILWTQLGLHASWTLGALAGGLLGGSVLVDLEGLEFILTALFVVLTMDAYRATPDRTTAVLAISAAGLALLIAPGSMVLVAITVTLRTLPFLLKRLLTGSALLAALGTWLPLGAVAILAAYCLAAINLAEAPHGLPELTGVAATVGVHGWRRNAVLSIGTGTKVCVLLTLLLS